MLLDTKKDIALWNRAKDIAAVKEKSTDWVYIITVYTYLGGALKTIQYTLNKERYRIVGELNDKIAIVYNQATNTFDYVSKSFVELQQKDFNTLDYNLESIETMYKLNRMDIPEVYREHMENPTLLKDSTIIGYKNNKNKS